MGFGLGGLFRAVAPSLLFLGEVHSVCYLLWLPFWLRVLLLIVCLAIGLFGNKFLIIQKKKEYLVSILHFCWPI